jgi:acetaldehyde dehydrogenase
MTATKRAKVAVLGSGNIGTDLMVKILRSSQLELFAMAGIDPLSAGLAKAERLGVTTTSGGAVGLCGLPGFESVTIVFDATSAASHVANATVLAPLGKRLIDLTPAAIGPYVVPVVNLDDHLNERNLNMVTCGGQATVPIVAAISSVADVRYAEIVASIASKSAGPGTRANIDEFTQTTSRGLESVGGAARGKAIIILNPAEPPMLMRDTVFCLLPDGDPASISKSVENMVGAVQKYVTGYRMKQDVQFDFFTKQRPLMAPGIGWNGGGIKVSVFLEVEGAADYLPAFAGNLDIMTSAAVRTAERIVERDESVA